LSQSKLNKEINRTKKLKEAEQEQEEEKHHKKLQLEEKLKRIHEKKEKERILIEREAFKDYKSHMDTVRIRRENGSRSVNEHSGKLSPNKSSSTL